MRKVVLADVVFHIARYPNQKTPLQELENAQGQGNRKQHTCIPQQFWMADLQYQTIDYLAQNAWADKSENICHQQTGDAGQQSLAIRTKVSQQSLEGSGKLETQK